MGDGIYDFLRYFQPYFSMILCTPGKWDMSQVGNRASVLGAHKGCADWATLGYENPTLQAYTEVAAASNNNRLNKPKSI